MTHLTDRQAAQLSRALDRAEAEHITVAGCGTIKATGEKFWVVRGSTGNQYFVRRVADQLTCTCKAGEFGILCKHRAAVYAFRRASRLAQAQVDAAIRERAPLHRPSAVISIFR